VPTPTMKRKGNDGCAIDRSQRSSGPPLWLIAGLGLVVLHRRWWS
jgi:MYXO-CTERM domain-containing protein